MLLVFTLGILIVYSSINLALFNRSSILNLIIYKLFNTLIKSLIVVFKSFSVLI